MKKSLYRLVTDIIKADDTISIGELNLLDELCKYYDISEGDMIESTRITLSQAVDVLRGIPAGERTAVEKRVEAIPMSDGEGCSMKESVLVQAVRLAFRSPSARVISMPSTDLPISHTQIIYVENRSAGTANSVLGNDASFDEISGIVRLGGYEIIYIPRFAKHYSDYNDGEKIRRVLSVIAPAQTEEQTANTVAILQHLSTRYFYLNVLRDKLKIPLELGSPAWLIRLADDVVDGRDWANFLCIDVERDVKAQLREFISEVNSRMHEYSIMVNVKRDFRKDFMYTGFYKAILDVLTVKEVNRWGICFRLYGDGAEAFCDPENSKKTVLTIRKGNVEFPVHVSARDAAYYCLLLCASISEEEIVNFNDMSSFRRIQERYELIYQHLSRRSVDGGTDYRRCPDVTAPQTRIPMRSRLCSAIKASRLTEQSLYLPHDRRRGEVYVPLESERIQVMDHCGNVCTFKESVLYRDYYSI